MNHLLFHGALREMHVVGTVALALKLLSAVAMMVTMFMIFLQLKARLRELFAGFSPAAAPDPDSEKDFFAKRARRKALCAACLMFAVGVLVFSAFPGFGA